MTEEAEIRELCKRGRKRKGSLHGEIVESTPEWEYQYYLEHTKLVHELLRQWCGYRAVSAHERLAAAESEVRRLDLLLTQTIDSLRASNKPLLAQYFEEEQERERILPHRVRAVPNRPLEISEMPIVKVPARRRWGW